MPIFCARAWKQFNKPLPSSSGPSAPRRWETSQGIIRLRDAASQDYIPGRPRLEPSIRIFEPQACPNRSQCFRVLLLCRILGYRFFVGNSRQTGGCFDPEGAWALAVEPLCCGWFTAVTRVQVPSGTDPLSRRFLASSGDPGSFERVETPRRLDPLPRKKVGTETTRTRITAAPMPPHSMRRQLFCCPHFSPAVAVSTTNYQQLLAPPVPRSRCNHC
jgi:hypothetical protein